jgi:hypothetical protein
VLTTETVATPLRRQDPPSILLLDPRRYGRHRGYLLVADRLYVRGRWTPLVRVRARVSRASDGGADW